MLTWQLVNAETAVLRTNSGEEALPTGDNNFVGNKPISLAQTTVYTLIARSQGGEAATQVTITVNSLVISPTQLITTPVASFQAQPAPTPAPAPQAVVQASPLLTPTVTLAPLRFDLTPPTAAGVIIQPQTNSTDSAQTQHLLLFGTIALVLIVPLGIGGLALLLWAIWRQL